METSLVYTQIFIADPNEEIQNFNIFGAGSYSVLPIENDNEFIIGAIDEKSNYVRSLDIIEANDLYENTDYLEKLYSTVFLPQVHVSGSYGEYPGNLDLGLSRIFTKPYDIYDFITDDKQAIVDNNFIIPSGSLPINSSATEILISNDDCSVELNPSNVNNLNIENTANSSERGILVGDYSIVKEHGEKFKKSDNMNLPRLEQKINRQAF